MSGELGPSHRSDTFAARAVRSIRHAIVDESRGGRAAEIAAWSNGATAVGVGLAISVLGWERLAIHAAWLGLAGAVLMLVVLRLALTHRLTVWVAAVAGTLSVAALSGSLAWLFAHVVENAEAPSIAALAGALLGALAPAWGYAHIARCRANDVRDSLVDPVSGPHSRPRHSRPVSSR
ncbi:MAG: hypothetical protein JWO86_4909 [Myxococcaceae bacterium]|nr:hypothetical protein [Myxococcaceae bacterium]MEA2749618.1 hypothetical protein [Myxococcales bacterium]